MSEIETPCVPFVGKKKVSHETRENREKAEKEKRAPQLECFSVLS